MMSDPEAQFKALVNSLGYRYCDLLYPEYSRLRAMWERGEQIPPAASP
jgi:hypothetical protein